MKYDIFRKKFLKEAAVFGGGIAALALVAGGVNLLHTSYEKSHTDLNSQIQTTTAQTSSLEAQLVKAKESLLFYQTISQKNQNAGFELNREGATKLLDGLKNNYRLSGLSLKMSPVVVVSDTTLQKKTASVITSDVSLTFNGLTDGHLIAFVNAIKVQFPGYVRFSKFEITRVSNLSKDIFMAISRGSIPNLVQGQVEFKWLGLKYNAPSQPENPPPAEGGGT